jgi:hypothetical protein
LPAGLVLGTCLAFAAVAAAGSVSYPDFEPSTGLSLNGDTETNDGKLVVTPGLEGETGSAFTEATVVRPNHSFSTRFVTRQTSTSGQGGDGMAFVIQTAGAEEIGNGGGELGYGGLGPGLALEFDLFFNIELGDNFGKFIALTSDGDPSNVIKEKVFPRLDKGKVWTWVRYSADETKMKVWASREPGKPKRALFAANVDLNFILGGERAYAGFTGATGSETAAQRVFSWHFNG